MGNFVDLIGQRFERLLVVKRSDNVFNRVRWSCKCDCGKSIIVYAGDLKTGKTKSCGCLNQELREERAAKKFKDLTGQKFGRLTVIKRNDVPEHIKYKYPYWLCRCDCGNEKIIRGETLKEGRIFSCGCYKKERARELNLKPRGETTRTEKYKDYMASAKRKNLIFDLTKDYFLEITSKNCYYCDKEPSNIHKSRANNGDFIYNGIDRLDSSLGYTLDNIVPCCWICNQLKGTLSENEFLKQVENIYNHRIKK